MNHSTQKMLHFVEQTFSKFDNAMEPPPPDYVETFVKHQQLIDSKFDPSEVDWLAFENKAREIVTRIADSSKNPLVLLHLKRLLNPDN